MVFEPTGGRLQSLVGNENAIRLPVRIEIGRKRPLTTRMWEQLFREMDEAAFNADMRLYEEIMFQTAYRDSDGIDIIQRQTDRFVIISVSRGSIVIGSLIALAVGIFVKEFIKPGWDKSASKAGWDDGVALAIDKVVPILKEQIDYHVMHKLKRLKIRRVAIEPPNSEVNPGRRLSENATKVTELTYDKPKQITDSRKKKSRH